MCKFKVGDKVRCVSRIFGNIHWGREYFVERVHSRSVHLTGISCSYSDYHFELVTPEPTNQWQVCVGHTPINAIIHTMPDGVLMWRIPEPVITDGEMRFQPSHEGYDWDEGIYRTLKGKTKDGKPFGVWTVDFGGDTC